MRESERGLYLVFLDLYRLKDAEALRQEKCRVEDKHYWGLECNMLKKEEKK